MTNRERLEFQQARARQNLETSIQYRQTLEWVMLAVEQGIVSKDDIIKEIEQTLVPQKTV